MTIPLTPPTRPAAAVGAPSCGFLLALLSPVWRAKLCRGVSPAARRHLELEAADRPAFEDALALACGEPAAADGLAGLAALGRFADRYGLSEVGQAAEWEASRRLSVATAAELLASEDSGRGLPCTREVRRPPPAARRPPPVACRPLPAACPSGRWVENCPTSESAWAARSGLLARTAWLQPTLPAWKSSLRE